MEKIDYQNLNKNNYQELFKNKDYKELFKELKDRVYSEGLNNKIPIIGTFEIILVLTIFFLAIYSSFNWNLYTTIPLFILAFWRSTFVAHDVIHYQYYNNRKLNKNLGFIFGNIIIGTSRDWWERDHNVQHHTWTNSAIADEDIKALGGIFTKEKLGSKLKHKFKRLLFWGAIFFMWHSFHQQSYKYIIDNWKTKPHIAKMNLFTILLHYILVSGSLLYNFTFIESISALFIIYFVYSFFAALGFITNHIGMEVLEGEEYKKMDWFELQTRTSRNIKGGWFVHWCWGGLNTQIEHHLFPKTPRLNLLRVAEITKEFCDEKGLFYYETTPMVAFKEIDLELQEKGKFNYEKH